MILYECPHCGKKAELPDFYRGGIARCADCKREGRVPAGTESPRRPLELPKSPIELENELNRLPALRRLGAVVAAIGFFLVAAPLCAPFKGIFSKELPARMLVLLAGTGIILFGFRIAMRAHRRLGELTKHERVSRRLHETGVIEVLFPDGKVLRFSDYEELRDRIAAGLVDDQSKVRCVPMAATPEASDQVEWGRLEDLSAVHYMFEVLFRPLWARIKMFSWCGVVCVTLLKALDSTILFVNVDDKLAMAWIGMVTFLWIGYLTKKPQFLLVSVAISLLARVNLWFGYLAVAVIGLAFGAPVGAIVGLSVGIVKSRLSKVPLSVKEGTKPYMWGLLVPMAALAVLIPVYFFWLNPMILDWLRTHPLTAK